MATQDPTIMPPSKAVDLSAKAPIPKPPEGLTTRLTWSPLSGMGGLVEGLWGGLDMSKIEAAGQAVKEDIRKRDKDMSGGEALLTDIWDTAAGFATIAGRTVQPILPRIMSKEEAASGVDPAKTTADMAREHGEALSSGAIGGTGGSVVSLAEDVGSLWNEGPSHLTRTIGARPLSTILALDPALRAGYSGTKAMGTAALMKAGKVATPTSGALARAVLPPSPELALARSAGVEAPGLVEGAMTGIKVGAEAMSNVLPDAIKNAGQVVSDTVKTMTDPIGRAYQATARSYMKNLVDGFYTGDKRSAAMLEDMARSPERAADILKTARERVSSVAKGEFEQGVMGTGKVRNPPTEADVLSKQEGIVTQADQRLAKAEADLQASRDSVTQWEADRTRRLQELSARESATQDPAAKAAIRQERSSIQNERPPAVSDDLIFAPGEADMARSRESFRLNRMRTDPDFLGQAVSEAEPMGPETAVQSVRVLPGGKSVEGAAKYEPDVPRGSFATVGAKFGPKTNEVVAAYTKRLSEALGVPEATITPKFEEALGRAAIGDWTARLASDPKGTTKLLIRGIEEHLGRSLSQAERLETVNVLKQYPKATEGPYMTEGGFIDPKLSYKGQPDIQRAPRTLEEHIQMSEDPGALQADLAPIDLRDIMQNMPFKHGWFQGGGKGLKTAIDTIADNLTRDMGTDVLKSRVQAEMDRVVPGSGAEVVPIRTSMVKILGTDVPTGLPEYVAGVIRGLERGDLIPQLMPKDKNPGMVANTLRELFPNEPKMVRAADKLDKYRKLDAEVVGSEGWADPDYADGLEWHLKSSDASRHPLVQEINSHLKAGPTAGSIGSGINNVGGNAGMGSVRRGIALPIYIARAASLMNDLAAWKAGKLAPNKKAGLGGFGFGLGWSDLNMADAFNALEGSGVWSNDFINQELKSATKPSVLTVGRDVPPALGGKYMDKAISAIAAPIQWAWEAPNKLSQAFYRSGDLPFRLEESLAQYGLHKNALNALEPDVPMKLDQGRQAPWVKKNVDGSYDIAYPEAPNASDRGFRPIGEEALNKELGKTAAFRGSRLVGDYGDLPGLAKKFKTIPLGPFASYASWTSIFSDLPGKAGMFTRVLAENPYRITTTSPNVLALEVAHNAALWIRRNAITQAALQDMIQGKNRELQDLFRNSNTRDQNFLIDNMVGADLLSGIDIGKWASFGPTTALLKLGVRGYQAAFGASEEDVTAERQAQVAHEEAVSKWKTDVAYGRDPGPVPVPPMKKLSDGDIRLLRMAEAGQLGNTKDALNYINIGGSLLGDYVTRIMASAEDPKKPMGIAEHLNMVGPMLWGGTRHNILDGVAGFLTDPDPDVEHLRINKADNPTAQAILSGITSRTRNVDPDHLKTTIPYLAWVMGDFFGKLINVKELNQGDPQEAKSFLSKAEDAARVGAGVIPEGKGDAMYNLAKVRLDNAKKSGDEAFIRQAQSALNAVNNALKVSNTIDRGIEIYFDARWKAYQQVFKAFKGKNTPPAK